MIIQIDGVNTVNKGAELMLVSILEELEKRVPGATVYINPDSKYDETIIPKYNLNVKKRPGIKLGKYFNAICNRLKLNHNISFFKQNYSPANTDMILDASGFKYSDQWDRSNYWLDVKESYYKSSKEKGIKIYFLTQAFGPFETPNGKRSVNILSNYCNLIFAREKVSYNYLLKANANEKKVKLSCDFTFKTKGSLIKEFNHLKNAVAIIPNKKMISHGGDNKDGYIKLFVSIIQVLISKGEKVFFLNHESAGDYELANILNAKFNNEFDIVSGISAKDVKQVIGNSKMVISSRFHGVASSLSQGVPCLATSWNHKYEMLFNNFNQTNKILNSNKSIDDNLIILDDVFNNYSEIRTELKSRKKPLLDQINLMWDLIFENYENS